MKDYTVNQKIISGKHTKLVIEQMISDHKKKWGKKFHKKITKPYIL